VKSLFQGSDHDLEYCRVIFFAWLLLLFWSNSWDAYGQLSPSLYRGLGPPPDSAWLPALNRLWLLSLACASLGFLTRLSTWLAFALGVYLLGLDWSFGNTHHTHHLILLCLAALAWARCGQRFSLDERLTRSRPSWRRVLLGESSSEGWCVRLCQLLWCLLFFNAGLAKLRHSGLAFVDGENFQHILLFTQHWYEGQPSPLRGLVLHHAGLASLLAACGLALELSAPLAFFVRTGVWRWGLVLGLALLQVGASQLMHLDEFRKMAACYVFWIPWSRLALAVASLKASRSSSPEAG